jgi:membrane-associated phospholipid phosphatase
MAAVFDAGAVGYWALPTAPPWWSSEAGLTGEPVRRIMVEVGEPLWGRAWGRLYAAFGGNPWAAMPSLHFATTVAAAVSLSEASPEEGAVGWGYALTLGFGLVYLGEHYVTDLLAGAGLVAAVRGVDPVFAPAVGRVSAVVQRLERIADRRPR